MMLFSWWVFPHNFVPWANPCVLFQTGHLCSLMPPRYCNAMHSFCSPRQNLTHPLRPSSSSISSLESSLVPSTLGFLTILMVDWQTEPQYFVTPPVKRKSLFPYCLNPNWPYDILWPIECGRNDAMWVPEPGPLDALRRPPWPSWNAALRPPSKEVLSSLPEGERLWRRTKVPRPRPSGQSIPVELADDYSHRSEPRRARRHSCVNSAKMQYHEHINVCFKPQNIEVAC